MRAYVVGSVALVAGRVRESVRLLDQAWSYAGEDPWLGPAVAARQALAALTRGCGEDIARWTGHTLPRDGSRRTETGGGDLVRFAALTGPALTDPAGEALGLAGQAGAGPVAAARDGSEAMGGEPAGPARSAGLESGGWVRSAGEEPDGEARSLIGRLSDIGE
ncbi:hypothetical protein AB0C27_25865 [Nonomuraea sp. NPDC048882]|uniref:hypothetical protein n=1 Tax=unclassified Nonomuraea TaxID=2593643 RepID=UPI0033D56D85